MRDDRVGGLACNRHAAPFDAAFCWLHQSGNGIQLCGSGRITSRCIRRGGSTQTAFGARSATTMLHKMTVASFVIFILTTISIALVKSGPGGGTVMAGHKAVKTAPAKPAPLAPTVPVPVAPAAPVKQ